MLRLGSFKMDDKNCSADSVGKAIKCFDNFLYSIANNVICAICQELFVEPVTNQCGHSFCLNCIKRFHAISRYGKVNCPLCRHLIKRRSWIHNPVLSKIAEICFEAPAAFKEDVKKLNGNSDYDLGELVKSSRIIGICEEKIKDNVAKKKELKICKKMDEKNVELTKSNMSLVLCSISNNEENTDLKSISEINYKSESISDATDVEKKLKNFMGNLSTNKVNNWLLDGNGAIVTPDPNQLNNDGGEKLFMEPSEGQIASSETSMIRIDYLKSKKLNDICSDKTLTLEKNDDPYEFIVSQVNAPGKRKRASRRRKKTRPQFETVRTFGKEKLMKDNYDNPIVMFCDKGSSVASVQKPVRTYRAKSSRSKTMHEINEGDSRLKETVTRGRTRQACAESKDSCLAFDTAEDDSDVAIRKDKRRAKRMILSSYPDSGANYNSDFLKKAKVDDNKNVEVRKSCKSSKCTESPGWSRVTNLKIDFESSEKRSRPCRKTLNISGGELSVNASKMKSTTEISPENNKEMQTQSFNDLYIEDLSQNSDVIIGFDDVHSKKEDVKVVVGKMEKQLENVCSELHDGIESESKNMNRETTTANDGTLRKEGNRNTVPFALLGKIKKRKKMSIVFVKMGRLSPYLINSGKTIVKLVFSSVNREKTSVEVQTNEAKIKSDMLLREGDNLPVEMKVDVGVQTTQDILSSTEVDTSQRNNHSSIAIQTEATMRLQLFEEFNTPGEEVRTENRDNDIELNTELQCELNKTWMATPAEMVNDIRRKENGTVIVSNGKSELINPLINNINTDSSRVACCVLESLAAIRSAKPTEIFEESDSDIFIDQTPPRDVSANGEDRAKEMENKDESFLIISECQSNTLDSDKLKLKSMKDVEKGENNQNEPIGKSQSSLKNRELCIVSSGISNRKIIEKFVNRFKVEYSSFPKKEMTHLVVGLHENEEDEFVPYCTPKFLYAVANKKWIVTESWIEECLKSEAVVREEPFESVDPVGGNGCNIARLSTHFLLDNWEIYLYGKFVTIAKEEFAELIRDCGGTIVPHLKDFSYNRNKIRMILLDSSGLQEKRKEYEVLSKTYRTLVMSRDVAIMSIQSYKMVNFTPFVQHHFSTEECVEWGYPFRLVKKNGNLDDSCSDGMTQ